MADTTTTGTPTIVPVTSQDVTSPASLSNDNLEAQQSADTFKALSALFDEQAPAPTPVTPAVTQETTPPAPTPTPVTPETPPADNFESQLDSIKPAERAHPNVQKGMDELRRISREEHKARTEAEIKLTELQTQLKQYEEKLKTPSVPDDVKKELEDLRNMRRELDLKLDPDFQKNYVQPVKDAETNIMRILTEAGLKEETAKWIQDKGGLVAMSRSNDVVDEKSGMTAQQWVEDVLLAKTPTFHRNRALGELTNALNVQDKASRELQDFQGAAKERWEAKMQKLTTEFNAGRDAAIAELGDTVKERAVSPTASPEERAEIEAHNTRLRNAAAKFNEYMKTSQDPKVAGALLVKATQADVLLEANKVLEAKVASLQTRLNDIKAAGSHSRAGDSTPPPAPAKATPADLLKIPDNKALGDLLTSAGITR